MNFASLPARFPGVLSRRAKLMRSLCIFSFLWALGGAAPAEDCNTSCGDQCRAKVQPLGPLGPTVEFIEPMCNIKCEAWKKTSCLTGLRLPTVPLTPIEQVRVGATLACTLPQQVVLQFISSRCGFMNNAQSAADRVLIDRAKQTLINAGLIQAKEFEGVGIYFCNGIPGAGGIAPDRDLVYLHSDMRQATTSPYMQAQLAALLAHEMAHVNQYRQWGTDKFKCDYARQYTECGFCQDTRNSIENTAYQAQGRALDRLSANLAPNVERMIFTGFGGSDTANATRAVLPFSRIRNSPSDIEYEWFKFTSPSNGRVEVRLSGTKIRFLARLERIGYPRVGELIVGPSDPSGNQFQARVIGGETYYVGIQKYDRGSSGVQLDVSFLPP